ncbi:MAG TPA: hypothetical protein VGF31_10405 [Myxococcaceae bacterium]
MSEPAKVDPEVAAVTFAAHLDEFFAHGRGRLPGWDRITVDELHTVIRIPATRPDGTADHYFVRLGADYYPVWPPIVTFVRPDGDGWAEAAPGSRLWPEQSNQPGFNFGLHATYQYPDGTTRQLVCFSHSFDYYISNHVLDEDERWCYGMHTLTATLSRLAEVLRAPNYQGPSGAGDS